MYIKIFHNVFASVVWLILDHNALIINWNTIAYTGKSQNIIFFTQSSKKKRNTSSKYFIKEWFVNWMTMTRKSGEHLLSTYRKTEQVFRPY